MWTKKAVLYTGLGIALVLFSPFINNLQLLLLGITILGYVALHGLVNTRPIKVRLTRRFSDEKVFEGAQTEINLIIQNRGRAIGFLEVYDTLPPELELVGGLNHAMVKLRRREVLFTHYALNCPLRGQYTLGNPQLRLYNPSFFFFSESEVESESTLVVFPAIEEIEGIDLSSDFPKMYQGAMPIRKLGTSGEFYGIRDYFPGDDFKTINWRVFGRTRKLMVNQYEREDISDIMIVLDAREITGAGTVQDNPLTYGCRAAAALVNFFLNTRNRVGMMIYGETVRVIPVDTGQRHLYALLTALAEVKPAGDLGLHTVMGDLRNFTPRSPVMVISLLEEDASVSEAMREITARGFKLTVLAPDTLEFDRDAKIISPTIYFTALAELENRIAEAQSLGARALRWDPHRILTTTLLEAL